MESRKGARPYRVRFRHSTCPASTVVTGADYKKYDFFFDPNQVWLKTRRTLTFHDQSRSIYYDTNNAEDDSENEATRDGIVPGTPPLQPLLNPEPYGQDQVCRRDEPTRASQPQQDPAENTPTCSTLTPNTLPAYGTTACEGITIVNSNHECCTHVEDPSVGVDCDVPISRFPNSCKFDTTQEASLFRHYVNDLARWFDVCNPHRPFSYAVPRLAAQSPILQKAILAHSAHHISRVTGSDRSLPFQYLEECLALLIPKLKNESIENMDVDVVIATIFLRSFGEFEDIASCEFHISGTSLFIESGGGCESLRRSNKMRNAAYWIHLRQEICYSILAQRNIRANLNICPFDTSTDPRSDAGWCNRVVWICVQVLRWAFGGNSTQERWDELSEMIQDWESRRPPSFEPIFDQRGPFDTMHWGKEVWFTNDEHVDALQFLLTAKLMLAIHDPSIPKIGVRAQTAQSNAKAIQQFYIRTMCVVAKCSSFVPARFKACDVLFACGGCFHLPTDRAEVIAFMRDCERSHGYATKKYVDALLKLWEPDVPSYHLL